MPLPSPPILVNRKPPILFKLTSARFHKDTYLQKEKLLAKCFLTCFIGLFSKQTEEAGSCGYAETSELLSPPVDFALTQLPLMIPVLGI